MEKNIIKNISKKKSLLFVIDSLECGGAEKSLISLLPLIDYSRNEVDLLMIKRGGTFEKFIPPQVNVIDHQLYGNSVLDKIRKTAYQVGFSIQVRLKKHRHGAERHWRSMHSAVKPLQQEYDVAVAYQQGLPTFFVATKVFANKKMAWINADIYKAGYNLEYCRQFYEQMDYVVPVSETLREKLNNQSPWISDRLTCIYDIVNQDLIKRMASESVSDMMHKDDEITIVTVGRLAPPKNHLLAVNTARLLRNRGLNFKWYFIGEGGTRTAIERRIAECDLKDDVILLGLRENPYPYMAQADIYVQTSSFEGFGLTIAEAKILHKPIVSTNFDIVYDQITDRKNGLIAEMKPDSVADRIMELVNDGNLRDAIVTELKQENNLTSLTEIKKFNHLIEG